ncbi:uncharacterized protein LOC101738382 isoform X2 [Bombyx mori]|uniref:Uncharacterized protein n=1 Tax=Bombyx mori TaxID=7091 RepID=A0A8R2HKR6_BOMMO|nr:uncharacterized protein LOC101738382 isoform X2 [Bombyx mori]
MDHYLTTYRKDYLWPNLPHVGGDGETSGLADTPKLSGQELAFYQACMQHTRPPDCRCPQYSGGEMPQLPPGKEGGWSRNELQSKYPMLYSILQNEASPELKQRIDRDRNKTTYRVDYCETGPGAKFEGLQRAADDSGSGPCAQPMRLPGDPCRVGPKPRMTTPRTMSKQGSAGAGSDPRAKCETTSAVPPLGKSEYQDGVSKLGAIIMRDKLHRR